LPLFSYASTASYFVTLCTKDRQHYFGALLNGELHLSAIGKICEECLNNLPLKYSFIRLDEYVIMPNHMHAIFTINNPGKERMLHEKRFQPEKESLSSVIRNFKSTVTLLVRRNISAMDVWQPRFFDRIVRDENELRRIRTYIRNNPARWKIDGSSLGKLLM